MTPDANCPGHRWGAWSEEWPYVFCFNCGSMESIPPAPLPGSPPRWVLWLGGRLRRQGGLFVAGYRAGRGL